MYRCRGGVLSPGGHLWDLESHGVSGLISHNMIVRVFERLSKKQINNWEVITVWDESFCFLILHFNRLKVFPLAIQLNKASNGIHFSHEDRVPFGKEACLIVVPRLQSCPPPGLLQVAQAWTTKGLERGPRTVL